jgi:hypothetical protein
MSELKVGKLPDRTPVKITITVSPELNQALRQYAEIYRFTYGEAESVAELIPFMLGAFLDSDRAFAKARKSTAEDATSAASTESRSPRSRRTIEATASTTSKED